MCLTNMTNEKILIEEDLEEEEESKEIISKFLSNDDTKSND